MEMWNNIKEDKPKTSDDYLIATITGYRAILWFNHGENWWVDECDEKSDGYWERIITHWMLLPALPKDHITKQSTEDNKDRNGN